jgi:hypothetical protein
VLTLALLPSCNNRGRFSCDLWILVNSDSFAAI